MKALFSTEDDGHGEQQQQKKIKEMINKIQW